MAEIVYNYSMGPYWIILQKSDIMLESESDTTLRRRQNHDLLECKLTSLSVVLMSPMVQHEIRLQHAKGFGLEEGVHKVPIGLLYTANFFTFRFRSDFVHEFRIETCFNIYFQYWLDIGCALMMIIIQTQAKGLSNRTYERTLVGVKQAEVWDI